MKEIKLTQQDDLDLSVVIPVYNDTLKFENLLSSYLHAFAALPLKFELVIVDNNSPRFEEIYAIVKKFRENLQITVVMQPPLQHSFSLCSARNRGVLNARGRFIFFTDSDCLIDEDFATTVADICQREAAVSLESPRIYTGERVFVLIPDEPLPDAKISDRIKELPRVPSASNYGKVKDRRFPWIQNLPQQEHPWNFVHGCFILLEKEHYLRVGGSDTSYDGFWGYEEIDLVYRMVHQLRAEVIYLEKAKVYHQELPSDLEKIPQNTQRNNKSMNPNYQRICQRVPGFDEFKKVQWQTLNIITS